MDQQNIYDNNEFLNNYQNMRNDKTKLLANDLIEILQLFELIGDVKKRLFYHRTRKIENKSF